MPPQRAEQEITETLSLACHFHEIQLLIFLQHRHRLKAVTRRDALIAYLKKATGPSSSDGTAKK